MMIGEPKTFGDVVLSLPQDWRDRSVLTFHDRDVEGFSHNMTVTRDAFTARSLDAYCDEQLGYLGAVLPHFTFLAREPVRLQGRDGIRLDVAWTDHTGRRLRQTMWMVVADVRVVVLTTTALERTYAQFEDLYRSVAESLRVE